MKKLLRNLSFWVFAAMILGILVGYLMGPSAHVLAPLGTLFMQLIQMLVVPLVFISIVSGAATLGGSRSGRPHRGNEHRLHPDHHPHIDRSGYSGRIVARSRQRVGCQQHRPARLAKHHRHECPALAHLLGDDHRHDPGQPRPRPHRREHPADHRLRSFPRIRYLDAVRRQERTRHPGSELPARSPDLVHQQSDARRSAGCLRSDGRRDRNLRLRHSALGSQPPVGGHPCGTGHGAGHLSDNHRVVLAHTGYSLFPVDGRAADRRLFHLLVHGHPAGKHGNGRKETRRVQTGYLLRHPLGSNHQHDRQRHLLHPGGFVLRPVVRHRSQPGPLHRHLHHRIAGFGRTGWCPPALHSW